MYGIDFGTSNTVVVRENDGRVSIVPLEGNEPTIPSTLFIDRNESAVGRKAISRYRESLLQYSGKYDLDNYFRFFQGLKLALKDSLFLGTVLFQDQKKGIPGNHVSPEELASTMLAAIKQQARITQDECEVVVGRPVKISDTEEGDFIYVSRLREACCRIGFSKVHFVYEPVAATIDLVGKVNGNVVVFDFGGGTLDVTLSRISGDKVQLLANAGLPIGGFTLNEDLSRAIIAPYFGYGKTYTAGMMKKNHNIPSWVMRQVINFHALPATEIMKIRRTVADMMSEDRQNTMLRGLWEYLSQGLVYGLYEEIDRAKISLSSDLKADFHFRVGDYILIDREITRKEFELIISDRVNQARDVILSMLQEASVGVDEVDHVVRVGGSSQIPAFQKMLEDLFPGRVEQGETFTSIASGLLDAHRLGYSM